MIYSAVQHTAPIAGQRDLCAELLHGLIRHLGLWQAVPVVEHLPSGAPYLANYPELHFSQSHSRTMVAVALSKVGNVGIDVEGPRRVSSGLIVRVCTPCEQQAIAAADTPDLEFIRLWTRKEACLKCLGTGIHGYESLLEAESTAAAHGYVVDTLKVGEAFVSICHLSTDTVTSLP
ncbi:MAG: 4'-phosphopantetheinyl transferase superfamily protein [Bacteroidales bacterium]|nr:4'-phosphopantetheinyl transferase superfamily protein [Bacteroidales bacterium]